MEAGSRDVLRVPPLCSFLVYLHGVFCCLFICLVVWLVFGFFFLLNLSYSASYVAVELEIGPEVCCYDDLIYICCSQHPWYTTGFLLFKKGQTQPRGIIPSSRRSGPKREINEE